MASRVEKYYSEYDSATKRSQKNQDLYDAISELDKITKEDLAKLHRLFQDFEEQKQALDVLYPRKQERSPSRESLYSVLEDTNYDPFDLMVQRQYDKEIEEKKKIRELASEITNHLDILKTQESHLKNLKDLTYHPEKGKQSLEENNVSTTSSKIPFAGSISSLPKKVSSLFDDEKTEERALNLRIKMIVGIAFALNSLLIIYLIYRSIH